MQREPELEHYLDLIASKFSTTPRQEARARSECLGCHKVITDAEFATWSEAGQREFDISGFCEPCFDALFADDDESWILGD